jgi:stage III sporulation protein AB
MIKITGILMVFFSSSFLGVYSNFKRKNRIRELKNFINAFEILKSEMNFSLNLLSDISKKIYKKNKKNNNTEKFFYYFSENLDTKEFNSANEAWIDALSRIKNKSYLDEEDFDAINNFSNALKTFDKDLKIKTLELINFNLNNKIVYLEKDFLCQKKLFNQLGVLFGLLIIIIFL